MGDGHRVGGREESRVAAPAFLMSLRDLAPGSRDAGSPAGLPMCPATSRKSPTCGTSTFPVHNILC
jgi:hypothetical protein